MTAKKNVVKVEIQGDEYSIRSDATPEHTRAVAEHVDKTIKSVLQSTNVEQHKAAILAALQITDELFQAREASYATVGAMQKLSDEIRPWLPPSKRRD
ncbi:MAG: cell division protein ZapA [Gemmatimonadaceae bacterium]